MVDTKSPAKLPYPTACVAASDCVRPLDSLGLCRAHLRRWQRGDTSIPALPAFPWDIYERPVKRERVVWIDWSGITGLVLCDACGTRYGPYIGAEASYAAAMHHARAEAGPHGDQPLPRPRKPKYVVSDETLLEELRAGDTVRTVASRHNMGPKRIIALRDAHGIPVPPTTPRPAREPKAPRKPSPRTCEHPGCDRPRQARERCSKHYRWLKHGEPDRTPDAVLIEALWAGEGVTALLKRYKVGTARLARLRAEHGIPYANGRTGRPRKDAA